MSGYYSNSQEQIDFIIQVLKGFQSLPLQSLRGVDLGSDKGLHLLEIEKLVSSMYGVDKKINSSGLTKNYIELDFLTDNIPLKDLDFAYILSPCFEEAWFDSRLDFFLDNVSRILKKDGLFILDLFDFNYWKDGSKKDNKYIKKMKDGSERVVSETTYRDDNKLNLVYTLFTNDSKQEKVFETLGTWRIFEFKEISEILDSHGFKIIGIHKSFSDTKGDILNMSEVEANRIILTCCKIK